MFTSAAQIKDYIKNKSIKVDLFKWSGSQLDQESVLGQGWEILHVIYNSIEL